MRGSRPGVLTVWHVLLQDAAPHVSQRVTPIGLDHEGKRNQGVESVANLLEQLAPAAQYFLTRGKRQEVVVVLLPAGRSDS
jgi:hypothetical protein